MTGFEVENPILNSPYEEPEEYWRIVEAFVKNSGLGFAIPYFHNGEPHDYVPDFIIRLNVENDRPYQLTLETKGFDPLEDVKKAAAERWIKAVNADGNFGHWQYAIARKPSEVIVRMNEALAA